jgi:hypothetical protein
VPARFVAPADAAAPLRIEIDDARASYPVVVDPVVETPAWSFQGSVSNAACGSAVATAGDLLLHDGFSDVLVGCPGIGCVYLASGSESGPVLGAAPLCPVGGSAGKFGSAVAAAGDVNGDGYPDAVVGEPFGGVAEEGRVLLLLGTALDPVEGGSRTSGVAGAHLGASVAGVGDVNGDGYDDVAAGAPLYANGQAQEGAVYLYYGSAGGLYGLPIVIERDVANALLGSSVGPAGDVNGDAFPDVVCGAPGATGSGLPGTVYVHLGSGHGLLGTPVWTQNGTAAGDLFGRHVWTAGDMNGDGYADVAVGAPQSYSGAGSITVYPGGAAGPSSTYLWRATLLTGKMGPVAFAGDLDGDGRADVVGGAPNPGQQTSWLGIMDGRPPGELYPITSADQLIGSVGTYAQLGAAVAAAGDVNGDGAPDVIVGAPATRTVSQLNVGEARVYYGVPHDTPNYDGYGVATLQVDRAGAAFGARVAMAGDVNGDGYADLLASAPAWSNTWPNQGAAFLFLGTPDGPAATFGWSVEGNADYSELAIAGAGDVNGDGYDDLVVGEEPGSATWTGIASVYPGSATGPSATPLWTLAGSQAWEGFGRAVASAGDVNGDGFADLAIGAPFWDRLPDESVGRVEIHLGGPQGPSASASLEIEGTQSGETLGSAIAAAGDVNGDGYGDLLVGAPGHRDAEGEKGRVEAYLGSAFGLSATPAWTVVGDQIGAQFGNTLAPAGDVNGDGYSDVLIGAPLYSNGATREGAAFLYLGSATGLADTPAWSAEGDESYALLGSALASAGDVNQDGYSDVLVGSPFYYSDDRGRTLLYLGSSTGLDAAPIWFRAGSAANAFGGSSVAGAGDVDGDGFPEVVMGEPGAASGEPGEGLVTVAFGNLRRGLDRAPRMRLASDAAPIALLGRSESESMLRFAARGRTPEGRGKVRLEWEIRPLGTPFTGVPTGVGAFVTTGAPGASGSFVELNELASGLTPLGPARWRLRVATTSPFAPHSRWFTPAGNGLNELDVRGGVACSNGLDDDGDGFTDFPDDPGCSGPTSGLENPQCQDGINNDGDGLIDFDGGASWNGGVPLTDPDPQCVGRPWRNREAPNSCGLGVELAALVGVMRCATFRRRRAQTGGDRSLRDRIVGARVPTACVDAGD